MAERNQEPGEKIAPDIDFIAYYLKHGSMAGAYEAYYKEKGTPLGLSDKTFRRRLDQWGVVRSESGGERNAAALSETIEFFRMLAYDWHPKEKMSIEKGYREFKKRARSTNLHISPPVLHRVFHSIVDKSPISWAGGILAYDNNNPEFFVVGKDETIMRMNGEIPETIPICMSYEDEDIRKCFGRPVQQELLTDLVMEGRLGIKDPIMSQLLENSTPPFVIIQVAHVAIKVYLLELPENVVDQNGATIRLKDKLSSFRLRDLSFKSVNKVAACDPSDKGIRPSIIDIARAYKWYLERLHEDSSFAQYPFPLGTIRSDLNQRICGLVQEGRLLIIKGAKQDGNLNTLGYTKPIQQ